MKTKNFRIFTNASEYLTADVIANALTCYSAGKSKKTPNVAFGVIALSDDKKTSKKCLS